MNTFLNGLEWRRAEKTFANEIVENDSIEIIQNAMIQAPTSFGIQPFHIVRVYSTNVKERLQQVSYGQPQVKECDTLFVLCAMDDIPTRVDEFVKASGITSEDTIAFYKSCLNHRGLDWSSRQAYIALGFGLAACTELRVASCPMEGFDTDGVRKVLELPGNITPVVYLAVGKKSETPHPYPRFRFDAEDMVKFM